MGMFDTVWVECPHCEADNEIQSKAGDCLLNDYNLDNAPQEILESIQGQYCCGDCREQFEIQLKKVEVKIPTLIKK